MYFSVPFLSLSSGEVSFMEEKICKVLWCCIACLILTFLLSQGKVGESKLGQLCKELKAEEFLAADPEFDPADTPDVAAFLKEEGLSAVPL